MNYIHTHITQLLAKLNQSRSSSNEILLSDSTAELSPLEEQQLQNFRTTYKELRKEFCTVLIQLGQAGVVHADTDFETLVSLSRMATNAIEVCNEEIYQITDELED